MSATDSLELIHCAYVMRFGRGSVSATRFRRYLLDFQRALYRECNIRATSAHALMCAFEKIKDRHVCLHLFNRWKFLCRTLVLDKLTDTEVRWRVLCMLTRAEEAFTARYGPPVRERKTLANEESEEETLVDGVISGQ